MSSDTDELELSEIPGLSPLLAPEELAYLLGHVAQSTDPDAHKAAIALDLEQLQVAEYPTLYSGDESE